MAIRWRRSGYIALMPRKTRSGVLLPLTRARDLLSVCDYLWLLGNHFLLFLPSITEVFYPWCTKRRGGGCIASEIDGQAPTGFLLMGSDDETDINEGPWTATDDEDLKEAVLSGASLDEVATFLCRTPNDVAQRAAALSLKWRHGKLH